MPAGGLLHVRDEDVQIQMCQAEMMSAHFLSDAAHRKLSSDGVLIKILDTTLKPNASC